MNDRLLTYKAPLAVHWETTNLCNHKCQYCYNYWRDKSIQKEKVIKKIGFNKRYQKITEEIIKNKIYRVIITGGDPLISFNEVYPYIKALSQNKVALSINTNLTLLTNDVAQKISELKIPVLTSLQSYDEQTVNELTQSPIAFKRIINGIKLARKYNIPVSINMVVTQKNLGHIYKTAKLAKELGAIKFSAAKANKPTSCSNFDKFVLNPSQVRYIFDELKRVKQDFNIEVDSIIVYPTCLFDNQEDYELFGKRKCSAGKTTIAIGCDGSVRPCPNIPISFGNIDDGLQKAWKKMEHWRDCSYIPKKCKHCQLASICQGGCKVEAFSYTKDVDKPDPYANFSIKPCTRLQNQFLNVRSISVDDIYTFVPNMFLRKENFGGLLVNGKSQVTVDKKMYDFVKNNIKNRFQLKDLASSLNVSEEAAKRTIAYLLNRSLILSSSLPC